MSQSPTSRTPESSVSVASREPGEDARPAAPPADAASPVRQAVAEASAPAAERTRLGPTRTRPSRLAIPRASRMAVPRPPRMGIPVPLRRSAADPPAPPRPPVTIARFGLINRWDGLGYSPQGGHFRWLPEPAKDLLREAWVRLPGAIRALVVTMWRACRAARRRARFRRSGPEALRRGRRPG